MMKFTPKLLWIVGLTLAAIGETITAFDPEQGNTISEFWDRLPMPAKYAVVGFNCMVLGHWCWPMPTRPLYKNQEKA